MAALPDANAGSRAVALGCYLAVVKSHRPFIPPPGQAPVTGSTTLGLGRGQDHSRVGLKATKMDHPQRMGAATKVRVGTRDLYQSSQS